MEETKSIQKDIAICKKELKKVKRRLAEEGDNIAKGEISKP
jgi:hypothetical protein